MDHIYKYLRWLSLDIVLGAIFFLAYLEKYYQVHLSFHVYYALGSAVWLIYTTDHLMDGMSLDKPTSPRHLFHKRYSKLLILVAGVVLFLALINVYFLDIEIIRNGAILTALSVGYLLLVYLFRKLWVKEILVAWVYATGIYIGPFSKLDSLELVDFIWLFQLAGIALMNLLVFSYYDRESDESDGFNSLVLRIGEERSRILILCLSFVLLLGCIMMGLNVQIEVLYFLMTSILTLIFFVPKTFTQSALYRTIGDGIFYLPGLFLLFL